MKQNKIARQYAVQEIKKVGKWYSQEINRNLELFSLQDKVDKDYKTLVSVSDYPNCILSGWTWNRVFGGLLIKDSIRNQIVDFYEYDYQKYKNVLMNGSYKTDEPIWVVIHAQELEPDTVYPIVTNLNDSDSFIVLAINEIS